MPWMSRRISLVDGLKMWLEELDGKYTVIGQARDVESLRTLKQIEELPTNSDGRTLRPLAIRFFTLVDIPVTETRQLDSPRP